MGGALVGVKLSSKSSEKTHTNVRIFLQTVMLSVDRFLLRPSRHGFVRRLREAQPRLSRRGFSFQITTTEEDTQDLTRRLEGNGCRTSETAS
jgi:hypothetical protein